MGGTLALNKRGIRKSLLTCASMSFQVAISVAREGFQRTELDLGVGETRRVHV